MPGYYIYLASSLPMLHFGAKPPVSSERFLEMCRGMISDDDLAVLRRIVESLRIEENIPPSCEAERKWRAFDTALRNELAKIRAARRKQDPLKFVRQDGYAGPSIVHIALHAHRTPEPLEAERILEQARWQALDESSLGHYFDIDFMVIYAYKLLILERWERINAAEAPRELDKALVKA